MGHILGPFGIRGWIRVQPYTEQIDGLLNYSSWWLGKEETINWREVQLEIGRINGNHLDAKLTEFVDREQASLLKGLQIAVPRNYLPTLSHEQDAFFSP